MMLEMKDEISTEQILLPLSNFVGLLTLYNT